MNISHAPFNSGKNVIYQSTGELETDKSFPITGSTYFDFDGMDKSVDPGVDFYKYASGKWLENTEIPAAYSSWGSFATLRKQVNDNITQIMKSLDPLKSDDERLCKTLYDSIINMKLRNDTGILPIQHFLNQIDNIDTKEALFGVTAELMKIKVHPFASFEVYTDPYDNRQKIMHLGCGGIALPDHEMYLSDHDTDANKHAQKREKYCQFINDLFKMSGINIEEPSEKVMEVEVELAKVFLAKEDRKDTDKTINVMPAYGFWSKILSHFDLDPHLKVNVRNPAFLKRLDELITDMPLDTLKVYLKFHLLKSFSPSAGKNLYDLRFNFYSTELNGKKEQKPLDERAAECVSDSLGHLVGKIYVERYFSPLKKQKVKEMVEVVKGALIEKINGLDWMLPATKEKAVEKLKKMTIEIGYPDEPYWKDYSKLFLESDKSYLDHKLALRKLSFDRLIQKLQKPLEKKEWSASPQVVNAYNTWGENKITLPAGILDAPFFTTDDATSWGAFGMVIAHEIIHSFDDIGCKFDATGNKSDWWQKEDREAYQAHAKIIVEQFNSYSVPFEDGTSMNINGKMTLGENIADLGGLKIAFSAMKKFNYEKIDGFTAEQRFFLGFAQIWRMKFSDHFLKRLVNNDSHSAPLWRVNGTLSQMREFKEAFNLPDDCPMVIAEHLRSKMWS